MKRKKHIFKKLFLATLIFNIATTVFAAAYFFATTYNVHLSDDKLNISSAANYTFLDDNNQIISQNTISATDYVYYSQLQSYTINAFVAIEDKRFFEHHGIDYIRIFGAIKNNILHPKHKQGGSTITQQVIKNTHLSHEKTINRKLKEIKLAKELENKYSKEQILEIYLNSIYFGNGCYGIGKASSYYFDKTPDELTIAESALLASTINAPSVYDPINNAEKANVRKNLVLKLLKENKKISESEYTKAVDEKIEIAKKVNSIKNSYFKYALKEACNILHVTENQLANMNCKVNTYYNNDVQNAVINELDNMQSANTKTASIILDNNTKGIIALATSKGFDLFATRRQPGSLIKPILVYAPAFDCGKYSPASIVNDTPVSFGSYTPENANKKYLGAVSIRTAIEKSLNVPAVKILDDIGINYAKSYANKLGISFDKQDSNLALALGGLTNGTTIKELADAYMCFASSGKYAKSNFIKSIEVDGKLAYLHHKAENQTISEATSYLINNCLQSVAENGTAKKLYVKFPTCSKTGTVGNARGNTDAYNCSYTTEHTICTWIGTNDNTKPMSSSINGATMPTIANGKILNSLYKDHLPNNFAMPTSIRQIKLNDSALLDGKIIEDVNGTITEYFNENYLPKKMTYNDQFCISIDNNKSDYPTIIFDAKRAKIYQIYRKNGQILQLLHTIMFSNGKIEYIDKSAKLNNFYEYYVIEKDNLNELESNHIKLYFWAKSTPIGCAFYLLKFYDFNIWICIF